MLWAGQYFAYMTWLPQYLVDTRTLSTAGALLGYVVPVTLVLVFCVVTGFWLRSGVSLKSLLVGAMTSQVLVWACLPWADNGLGALASLVVYGAGAGIVPACLFAMPGVILGPGKDTARAFGIIMTGRNSGVLLGPVVLAQVYTGFGGWEQGITLFAVWTGLCLLCTLLLLKKI